MRQELKRKNAAERAATWNKLTPREQLKALDRRLGVGVGAEKQRAKLQAYLDRGLGNTPMEELKDKDAQ